MSVVLSVATAYLMYVLVGAVFAYVLIVRALRVDERAAMADLDQELREPVRHEPGNVRANAAISAEN